MAVMNRQKLRIWQRTRQLSLVKRKQDQKWRKKRLRSGLGAGRAPTPSSGHLQKLVSGARFVGYPGATSRRHLWAVQNEEQVQLAFLSHCHTQTAKHVSSKCNQRRLINKLVLRPAFLDEISCGTCGKGGRH